MGIAIEETIDVVHKGASLKGSFSRYEFQRESSGVSSVKNFKTLLPAAAKDVYYRDDIGNISTSHMKVMDDAVELDLRPRFPLFGGWKTHYVVGYNVPSYEYLFYKGDVHVLNMRLVDHIFDDMLVEQVELRVILPEGVSDLSLDTPYSMKRGEDSGLPVHQPRPVADRVPHPGLSAAVQLPPHVYGTGAPPPGGRLHASLPARHHLC